MAAAAWDALGGYLRSAALLGLIEAVIIGVAVQIAGGDLVIPVMVLTFLAAFVPLVGAVVAGAIAVLVTLATGGIGGALAVLIVAVVVQQLDNDLLAPFIYGHSLQLHPAVILLAIATGSALFGFAGTFLAVPVTAVVISSVSARRRLRAGRDRGQTTPERPVRSVPVTKVESGGPMVRRLIVLTVVVLCVAGLPASALGRRRPGVLAGRRRAGRPVLPARRQRRLRRPALPARRLLRPADGSSSPGWRPSGRTPRRTCPSSTSTSTGSTCARSR